MDESAVLLSTRAPHNWIIIVEVVVTRKRRRHRSCYDNIGLLLVFMRSDHNCMCQNKIKAGSYGRRVRFQLPSHPSSVLKVVFLDYLEYTWFSNCLPCQQLEDSRCSFCTLADIYWLVRPNLAHAPKLRNKVEVGWLKIILCLLLLMVLGWR